MSNEEGCGSTGCGCLLLIGLGLLAIHFWPVVVIIIILIVIGAFAKSGGSSGNSASSGSGTGYQNDKETFERNMSLSVSVMKLVGYVARGNDVISKQEIDNAEQIINRLGAQHRNTFIKAFNEGKRNDYDPSIDIDIIKHLIGDDRETYEILANYLLYIAAADGVINDEELRRSSLIMTSFGFSKADINEMIREVTGSYSDNNSYNSYSGNSGYDYREREYSYSRGNRSSSGNDGYGSYNRSYNSGSGSGSEYGRSSESEYSKAMRILGVTSSDTDEAVVKAYKRMVRKYHPDLVKAKGLPESMVGVYEQKTKEINEAYDVIKKYRNM